jgi:hypothetical protein
MNSEKARDIGAEADALSVMEKAPSQNEIRVLPIELRSVKQYEDCIIIGAHTIDRAWSTVPA